MTEGGAQHGRGQADLPGRGHYHRPRYVTGGRIYSFAHQIDAVVRQEPRRVVEVGPGPGIVTETLRTLGIEVTTVDAQAELNPDVVASVLELPFDAGSFDVAACCQVLEHLAYERFADALRELRRVTTGGCVLSLPDAVRRAAFGVELPLLGRFRASVPLPARPVREPDAGMRRAGHRWEIGRCGVGLSDVLRSIGDAGWHATRTWLVPEKPWHRFFALRAGG